MNVPCSWACFLKQIWICILILITTAPAGAWQMKQAPLMTRWASLVNTNAPLPEYPRPQMVRTNWMNLNGIWQFQPGATNDPVPAGQTLSNEILVPYPMESAISGVMQYYEFSWYRRTFTVPSDWAGKRIILHLDAVTWQATVYVNGQEIGVHRGGYDPFSYDITAYLNGGTNELIVGVYSPEDNGGQPRGKQTLYPGGIMYTSASGLWQPVWLEPVDASGINNLQIVPDVDDSQLHLTVNCYQTTGVTVVATVLSNSVPVSTTTGSPQTEMDLPVPDANLWSPDNPFLYNLQIWTVHNGITNDFVTSYFGMRKISITVVNGVPEIYLNNQPFFGIGPLDQGYWPDGIYTAPTDAALEYDLQEEKALGFNSVRKHEKVERQRWYYWADTLGLLVWQDMPTCNSYTGNPNPPSVNALDFIAELSALVTNHWNSPSIIMWDIFNEGQGEAGSGNGVGQTNTAYLVQLVEGLDPSRLVNEASGGTYFGVGEVYDNHNYPAPGDPTSTTQAAVDGEFGGIGLLVPGHLWDPSEAFIGDILATNTAAFATIYDSYIDDIVGYKPGGLNAAIETQITDVENECDGLLTYDRAVIKPDPARITYSNEKAVTGQLNTTTGVITANTLTVPTDYIDFWPLDQTNGTIAVDVTGTGNNGTVVGAMWSTNGQIHDCLSFNGTNDYVRINRDVFNDFSIAFWVQTTSTAASGAWRQGEGLVDGSVGAGADDFGTALVGSQFAFGTGNSDTTLVSTTPINDGKWHYCVATRVQSSGAMQLYVDGRLQTSGTGSTNSLTAPAYLRFGGIQSGGGFLNGSLDAIKIYDRALGSLEIAALYGDGAAPPAAPTNLTCVTVNGQVTLNWWEVPFATSYHVGRSVTSGGPYTLIANVSGPCYTDTNAVNGATYYYVVSAVDSAGTGPNSSEVVAGPVLQHRYSFTTDASDSVGGANGTLMGDAEITNGALYLPGGATSGATDDSYVVLPDGIVSNDNSMTIETWLTDNAGSVWAEPWSFGDSSSGPGNPPGNGTYYIGLIPHSGEDDFRAAFNNSASEIDVIDPTNPLPVNTEQYVVVTYDAPSATATLYLNGVPVGVANVPTDHEPSIMGDTYNDWLGRDQFGADPTFTGSLDELRIWKAAVSPLYITLSDLAGPNVLVTNLTPVSVSVTVTNTTMTNGQTQQAAVKANFPQVSNSSVPIPAAIPVWTSSNPDVLTVSASGLITAVSGGSATISAAVGGTTGTSVSINVPLTFPMITQQPLPLAGYEGGSAALTVGATGGELSYQWFVNGAPISGATNAILTLTGLTVADSGNYSVSVSNPLGSTNSAAAVFTIIVPELIHRWSFNDPGGSSVDSDSVGGANGTNLNGAYLDGNGSVVIPGSGFISTDDNAPYVAFPPGIVTNLNSITVETWVTDFAGQTWAEVWCFGGSTAGPSQPAGTNYLSLIPTSGDGDMRAAFKLLNEEDVEYPHTTMPLNAEQDVVLTYNNITTTATLYLNGVQVGINTNITITPASMGDTFDNWLGRDQYGDPVFDGSVDELRIYNGPLTPTDIINNHLSGPNTLVNPGSASEVRLSATLSGSNIVLTWPMGILLQAPSVLGPWTTNNSAVSPDPVPVTGVAQFFKVLVNP